ncbi:MAG TPA: SDR family NAD(P)-dependent oxidoreductase [Clostridiales bacterium]|nr:SDR family NAD(P)-dependent oxidoreductase [Clostridiales bacterium]HPP34794.1 SDR family NAD(P)-dependent oxidoreductase [Clostridiales bacterium]
MENSNDTIKTIVITGATSGIGLAAAKELAMKGAYVIGTGRSEERCRYAEQEVKSVCPDANITYLAADLSSLSEVRRLASDIRETLAKDGFSQLDVLINNAGTVSSWYISTVDGFELQFAVNHLAPFLLTNELLPLLGRSRAGTVICTSSGSHYRTRLRWNDIMLRKHYNTLLAYKQTKLANVLFVTELNRRLAASGSNIKAFALDPGLVDTDIGFKGTSGIAKLVWKFRSKGGTSPEVPAHSMAYLALDPEPRSTGKVYWKDCRPKEPSRYSQKPDVAKKLWELSERMCGIIGHKSSQEQKQTAV